MKNDKNRKIAFVEYVKSNNLILSGNVELNAKYASEPYSRFTNKPFDEWTNWDFIEALSMAMHWYEGEPMVVKIGDRETHWLASDYDDRVHIFDTQTGELLVSANVGERQNDTPWTTEKYQWAN